MNLEEYATIERDAMLQKESIWPFILRECAEKGYYTIPSPLAEFGLSHCSARMFFTK